MMSFRERYKYKIEKKMDKFYQEGVQGVKDKYLGDNYNTKAK